MVLFDRFWHALTLREGTGRPADGSAPEAAAYPDPVSEERNGNLSLLTPRERDLFLLLLNGFTLKKAAERMGVKYSTANTHMTAIYKKLKVRSRAELIIKYRVMENSFRVF